MISVLTTQTETVSRTKGTNPIFFIFQQWIMVTLLNAVDAVFFFALWWIIFDVKKFLKSCFIIFFLILLLSRARKKQRIRSFKLTMVTNELFLNRYFFIYIFKFRSVLSQKLDCVVIFDLFFQIVVVWILNVLSLIG